MSTDGFPIEPGQAFRFDGMGGDCEVDVVYLGPSTQRWEANVALPYITAAQEGETHVQFMVRPRNLPEVSTYSFYVDSDD